MNQSFSFEMKCAVNLPNLLCYLIFIYHITDYPLIKRNWMFLGVRC